jgi:ERCC4-related helicase
MTASPGGERTKELTIEKVGQLCLNMNSTIVVPTDQAELKKHVHKPELEVVPVRHSKDQDILMEFFMDYIFQIINKLTELGCRDLPTKRELPLLLTHFKAMSEQVFVV